MPSPGTADASDVFSQEHVFTGQRDQNPGFSHCEILHCSMKHQVSPVVYRVKKKNKNLPPVFISYIFFSPSSSLRQRHPAHSHLL